MSDQERRPNEDSRPGVEGCCVCGKAVLPGDQPRWGIFHGSYILTAHNRCWDEAKPEGPQIRFLDARWSEADCRAQGREPLPPSFKVVEDV